MEKCGVSGIPVECDVIKERDALKAALEEIVVAPDEIYPCADIAYGEGYKSGVYDIKKIARNAIGGKG